MGATQATRPPLVVDMLGGTLQRVQGSSGSVTEVPKVPPATSLLRICRPGVSANRQPQKYP